MVEGDVTEHDGLSAAERAVLDVLVSSHGRVVSRTELARAAGVRHHPRRVDALLVSVRRAVAPRIVRNVRSRGWMLEDPPST